MRDDIIEGYNWTKFPFREDPVTHSRICKDCWNGMHGAWNVSGRNNRHFVKGCLTDGCNCYCYAAAADVKNESAIKRRRTKERKANEKAELENSSMRAVRE